MTRPDMTPILRLPLPSHNSGDESHGQVPWGSWHGSSLAVTPLEKCINLAGTLQEQRHDRLAHPDGELPRDLSIEPELLEKIFLYCMAHAHKDTKRVDHPAITKPLAVAKTLAVTTHEEKPAVAKKELTWAEKHIVGTIVSVGPWEFVVSRNAMKWVLVGRVIIITLILVVQYFVVKRLIREIRKIQEQNRARRARRQAKASMLADIEKPMDEKFEYQEV